MRISDKAIVLQTIKYGDKKNIVKLYTRNHGLLTVTSIPSSAPSSKIKSSAVLALNLLDIELIAKQNKDVHQLTEASCYYVSTNVGPSIFKLSVAQFLNEILLKCIKEQHANPQLYDFIEGCLQFLNESEEAYINLHVHFLMELSKYLGIEPSNNFSGSNLFFDLREGKFSHVSLTFPLGLDREDSALLSAALATNCLTEKLSNYQRQRLLEIFVAYFQLHVPGFSNLKSMDVLKEVVSV